MSLLVDITNVSGPTPQHGIGIDAAAQKSTQLKSIVSPRIHPASLTPKPTKPSSSYENSNATFWTLGQDWWKQLYDGDYIVYGPEVFDKGLHGHDKEPGFYDSALKACRWVSGREHLMASPSVTLYENLNQIACQHFTGETGTGEIVGADKVGKFLAIDNKSCEVRYSSFFWTPAEREEINKQRKILAYSEQIVSVCTSKDADFSELSKIFPGLTKEELLQKLNKATDWYYAYVDRVQRKREALDAYIEQRSRALGLSQSIAFFLPSEKSETCALAYMCSTEELYQATETLFAEYNTNMAKASSQEEKLRLIADLFQVLEWLHPFPDGQGRTDLILLMKELCKHGFTPAILDRPYVSTSYTLDEWVDYLKQGMEKWQKEAARAKPTDAGVKA